MHYLFAWSLHALRHGKEKLNRCEHALEAKWLLMCRTGRDCLEKFGRCVYFFLTGSKLPTHGM